MRDVRPPQRPAGIGPTRWCLGLLLWGLMLSLVALLPALGPAGPLLGVARDGIGGRLVLAHRPGAAAGSDPAPDFPPSRFDGGPFRLTEYRGAVVVVNFWASWRSKCLLHAATLLDSLSGWSGRGARVDPVS